jgi:hypothetical protein
MQFDVITQAPAICARGVLDDDEVHPLFPIQGVGIRGYATSRPRSTLTRRSDECVVLRYGVEGSVRVLSDADALRHSDMVVEA